MSRNVKKNLIPKFNVPEGFTSKTYLEKIIWDGFENICKKYDYVKEDDLYKERLNKELKVINELDAEDYFLIVHDYVKSVGKSEVDISKLEEYFEKDVFDLISNANSYDIFLMQSDGMIDFLKKLNAEKFEDLVLGYAIYRPGPDKYIDELIKRKENNNLIKSISPLYDEITKDTYGMIIYLEQIVEIISQLAGFSYEDADIMKRDLIKKINIDDIRKKFLYGDSSSTESSNAGAIKNGVSEEIGELILDEMVEHAPYAYSKSSAISETMSMYLSAYDKYHYSGVYFKYFSKQ